MKTTHFPFQALRDDVYTHIVTLISTIPELGGWVLFCTIKSILVGQFERHIYTIVAI